jgi:hypothetical protein
MDDGRWTMDDRIAIVYRPSSIVHRPSSDYRGVRKVHNAQPDQVDMNRELMLDGNAAAGVLYEIFGLEMTASPIECANCGREGEVGTLLAFTQAPGVILRCPGCESVMLRIVQTPDAIYLDARGAVYLRLERGLSQS